MLLLQLNSDYSVNFLLVTINTGAERFGGVCENNPCPTHTTFMTTVAIFGPRKALKKCIGLSGVAAMSYYEYVGCQTSFTSVSGQYGGIDPVYCAGQVAALGFRYFAVYMNVNPGAYCVWSNSNAAASTIDENGNCNSPCPTNSGENCGGIFGSTQYYSVFARI